MTTEQDEVLGFWFEDLEPADWWRKSAVLDARIATRFGDLHRRASRCELWAWRGSADGRLAEILVLDQFSRNIYRDRPEAFAQDALALALAQEAIAVGADQALTPDRRAFVYLPFMHSESLVIHAEAVRLFSSPGMETNLDFERQHLVIIERFGRYPHRNAILGRESTPEELAFLAQPGSGF